MTYRKCLFSTAAIASLFMAGAVMAADAVVTAPVLQAAKRQADNTADRGRTSDRSQKKPATRRRGASDSEGVSDDTRGGPGATYVDVPADVLASDIDIDLSETQCNIIGGAPPRLWRQDSQADRTVWLSYVGGQAVSVVFKAGQDVVPWPTSLPATSDQLYVIVAPDATATTTGFNLAQVGIDEDHPLTAQVLYDQACFLQGDTLKSQTVAPK